MVATEKQKKDYEKMVQAVAPRSKLGLNCLKAFFVGGTICAIAQVIYNLLESAGVSKENSGTIVAAVLITAAVLLTALGIYDRIGNFAGAGSCVPITGFANAVAAPAIEHRKEGLVLGVGAKMFLIAGPVLVYGTLTSVVVGLIYYFVK